MTYKEIVAFTEGKQLDEIEKAQEKGKRPYQQLLSALLSATIGFIISMFLFGCSNPIFFNPSTFLPIKISLNRRQNRANRHNKTSETLVKWASEVFCPLFKLNRSRRFTSQIIEYSVNSLNLINNPAHHLIQYIIRDFSSLGCHEVYSCHRS